MIYKFYKTFTGVDFSREFFFRHTITLSNCVVFACKGKLLQRGGKYGTNIYERKKYTAFGIIHVTSNGDFHGRQFSVQHY